MKNKYRCSCCDEIRSNKNVVYRLWTQKVRPDNSEIVGICRKCNNNIKKYKNIIGVQQYIEWVLQEGYCSTKEY
jgi:hypothetical protein